MQVSESGSAAPRSFRERFEDANRNFARGQLDQAEADYLDLLQIDPRSVALLCRLGDVSLRRQRIPQAERYFHRALAVRPDFPWTYVGLASVLAAEGATDDALKLVNLVLEADPALPGVAAKASELETRATLAPPPRVIVVDGAEDEEGRALFVLAALAQAAPVLPRTLVRIVGCHTDSVRAAAERLSFEHGLDIEHVAPGVDALNNATLVVAVYMSHVNAAALALAGAQERGIAQLVAVQFPNARHSPEIVAAARAAHSPRAFARLIAGKLGIEVARV